MPDLRKLAVACAVALAPCPGRALSTGTGVIVHFWDGSSVSGVLEELSAERVSVRIGGGTAGWLMADVERIEERLSDLERLREMERAAGDDRAKRLAAARFARAKGLFTDYVRLAQELGVAEPRPAARAEAPAPLPPSTSAPAVPAPAPVTVIVNNYIQAPPQPPAQTVFVSAWAPTPAQPPTAAQRAALLREQEAAREAYRRRSSSPLEDHVFVLQQALDRSAVGLPFSPQPL